jgi:Fic family protein
VQAADFNDNSPGRLVPTERGALAFVPDPAPGSLSLDSATVRALASAERALGQLTGTLRAAGRQVNPHLVSSPLQRREALASSRMEGTHASPEQLVLLELEPNKSGQASAHTETREVLNYVRALTYGTQRLSELPICLRFIKELHGILMDGVRGDERPGEFRDVQNFIGASQDIREARFVPPPVSEMTRCLDELEQYISSPDQDLPLLVRSALIHYQFETIHPFRDGNGRVGRLLIPLLLCSYDKLEAPALYLSAHLERRRSEYTDLMLNVSRTGDFHAWVRFFLESVESSALESITRAEALLKLREEYHRKLRSARSSGLLAKLVDALFERPSIHIAAAAKLLELTPASASANVKKLVEAGILIEVTGRKRDQLFVAREILAVADGG